MLRVALVAGSAIASSLSATASAATSEEVAAKFGALDAVQDISISPDGKAIA